MNNILVFDFETTGLLHDPTVRPIEFFGLNVNEHINKTFEGHYLINCPFKLNPKIIDITGITDEELEKDGIDLEVFLKQLDKIFSLNYDYVVGHNIIKFDIPLAEKLLNRSIRKNNIFDTAGAFKAKLLGLSNNYGNHYDYHNKALSTPKKGLYFNLKLAIEHYEIEPIPGSLHRASTDVKYTYEVFKKQIVK